MIDPGHPRLSIVRQCELAAISRATFYRQPAGESAETLALDAVQKHALANGNGQIGCNRLHDGRIGIVVGLQ